MLDAWFPQPDTFEEVSEGRFAPARPRPHDRRPEVLHTIAIARRNLLAVFDVHDYTLRSGMMRMLGRQLVVINTPEDIKTIFASRHQTYERKSPQMRRALEILLGDGLFISDGSTWASRRPLVADIVHKNRVPTFAVAMEDVAAEFAERWVARGPDRPFDALSEMAELTAEIIARAVFGNRLGKEAAREVIEGFGDYQAHVDSFNVGYFAGFDAGLPIWRGRRLRRGVKRVHKVIEKVVTDHLSGHGDHHSMLDLLVQRQARSPDLGLDVTALRNEAATIFMAGYETTAATLTWAWYLLAKAPWVEERLHAELDAVVGNRTPTHADVPNLPWCRCIIEETLRLYPPVPFLARQASADDTLHGIAIEKGALVLIVPWLLHRTESLWPDAHAFKPERFLDERPLPYSYLPFSAGPRICPGLNFGLTEAILCLAVLANRTRVRLVPGTEVLPVCRLTLRPQNGMPVTAEARRK